MAHHALGYLIIFYFLRKPLAVYKPLILGPNCVKYSYSYVPRYTFEKLDDSHKNLESIETEHRGLRPAGPVRRPTVGSGDAGP